MALSDKQRIKRIRQVWLASGPSGFEVAAARQRYFAERPTRRRTPGWKWMGDLALGFAAAAVLLVGYDVLSSRDARDMSADAVAPHGTSEPIAVVGAETAAAPEQRVAAATATPPAAARSGTRIADLNLVRLEMRGEAIPVAVGVRYEVPAGERAVVAFAGERSVVGGPQVIEFTFEADRASGFVMHLSELRLNRPAAAPGSSLPAGNDGSKLVAQGRPGSEADLSSSQVASWTKVAQAMRGGDQQIAERELEQLSESGSAQNRDSAALALAQLWLARGEARRAKPVLDRLRQGAASAVVKRRASELYASLPQD